MSHGLDGWPWEAWATAGVLVATLVALVRGLAGPDLLLLGALAVLAGLGLFSDRLPDPAGLVAGFGAGGVVTVGALFVVAAGLTQTGATGRLTSPWLGRPSGVGGAMVRLAFPVAGLSAFLNNTPVVAMLLPVVRDWSRRCGLPASKLYMPLSYAAILGGMCTLIGTSTNLVVADLLRQSSASEGVSEGALGGAMTGAATEGLGLFSLAWVGVPCLVVGLVYLLTVGRWLLPKRSTVLSDGDDVRRYTVEMRVDEGSPMAGQTIERAGLRRLPGLYLLEVDRAEQRIAAVGPEQVLQAGDRLVFAGVVDSVVDLRNMRGLSPAKEAEGPASQRSLVEAVVSPSCRLVGRSIREGRFRTAYHAAVVAVARDGHRLDKKLGDVVLRAGDTLLLETGPGFAERHRNRRDFFLVSQLEDSSRTRHGSAPVAMLILLGMVVGVGMGWVDMLTGALLAAVAMWVSRCVTGGEARRSLDLQVLLVIGAAIGIGQAVVGSGLATGIAGELLGLLGDRPWLALLAVYVLTNVFTEMITNNAAAVLMFPIALATAAGLDVSATPFAVAVMIAASASFATPIGYQTNLMVYGPGGYRFSDYVRVGLPLNVLVLAVTMVVTPWAFPFAG